MSPTRRYWPALDGVRAVAVSLVVAYHLGDLPGGWLGVDVFFVLSGFLITTLLLEHVASTGSVGLGGFWSRRARRLLPGVLALLAAVAVYCLAGGPEVVAAQLRWPSLATLIYGANWQQIAAGHGYFAQFAAPDPLLHTWSLAVEEQYYLLWPLVVGAAALLARRRRLSPERVVGATAAALGLASAVWMGVAAHFYGLNRAYLGTDTRAWELLIGAVAACWARSAHSKLVTSALTGPAATGPEATRAEARAGRPWVGRLWSVAPILGGAVLAVGVSQAGGPPSWIFEGGLVVIALGALANLNGTVRDESSPLARVLRLAPLRWLGRISYSLYLWHWPVIVLVTGNDTGLVGARLLLVRLGLMITASCVSYYAWERPIRRLSFAGWGRRMLVPVGGAATAAGLLAATVTPVAAGTGALRPAVVKIADPLPISLPAGRVPSSTDPLRVWILGDSVMYDSSLGLTAALEATGDVKVVANSSFGGWGMTRDKYWPGDGESIIRQYHPELVIGTWSWDNPMAQSDPTGYEALLRNSLSDILAPDDGVDGVILLQFPTTGPYPLYPTPAAKQAAWISTLAGERAWDAAARAVVAEFPGRAAYVTDSDLFVPDGKFLVWMKTPSGQWLRARKVDDIHVCPYGAAEFGQLVESDLATAFGLGPMTPGWQNGAWIHDPRYNDPAGACPADQPSTTPYLGTPLP